jgi:hypothetical protein
MRLHHRAGVVLYEPPSGISPAVASFLFENGQSERAFAVALISLARKGIVKIGQKQGKFFLNRLIDGDSSLPREEFVILPEVFPGPSSDSYAFGLSDHQRLSGAFQIFVQEIETNAIPDLLSPHFGVWVAGIVAIATIVLREVISGQILQKELSAQAMIYPILIMIFGGYCLLAAVRVWPSTLRKLATYLPGVDRPRMPLTPNDVIPIVLTMSAFLGFAFLAALTSLDFSLLLTAAILLPSVFRRLLEAPTSAGRAVLADLYGFREFLSRADADRLNRENQPGSSPKTIEEYTAFAVALRVEKSWGEEFTGELLELIQMDSTTPRIPDTAFDSSEPIQLNIGTPKSETGVSLNEPASQDSGVPKSQHPQAKRGDHTP